MPNVYIGNYSHEHDYEPAKKFGDLVPISSGSHSFLRTVQLQRHIAKAIIGSKPDDFLIVSGSGIIGSFALALWLLRHSACNLLIYDRPNSAYVLRTVSMEELEFSLAEAEA